MIAIDPASRPTFDTLLHTTRGSVFPETFYSFLHNYVASVNEVSPHSPFPFSVQSHQSSIAQTPISATPTITKVSTAPSSTAATGLAGNVAEGGDVFAEPLPSDSDHRMERIWSDYESVEPYLLPTSSDSASLDQTIKEPVKVEYGNSSTGVIGRPFQASSPQNNFETSFDLLRRIYFL